MTSIVCICLFSLSLVMAKIIWPPSPSFEWIVTIFLTISFLLGSINLMSRIFHPTELYFELTIDQLKIKDLKPSGHGYRELIFQREDVSAIHFSNDSDFSSYVENYSGKQTMLVGEIFESWAEIRLLMIQEAKDIRITEQ